MVRAKPPRSQAEQSISEGEPALAPEIARELTRILDGIDGLRRLSPNPADPTGAQIARVFSIVDEALAEAVRQHYENIEDFDQV